MYSWSKDAAAEANRRVKQLGIDRPPMAETRLAYLKSGEVAAKMAAECAVLSVLEAFGHR